MRALRPLIAGVTLTLTTITVLFAAEPAPILKVPQPDLDLGVHKAGPPLEFAFTLRNEGSAPLEIKDVQLSCGCLSAKWDRSIPPGKEMALRVTMSTAGEDGMALKLIRVTTNDPQTPVATLVARAMLEASIRVLPGRSVPLSIKRGQDAITEVTFASREPGPLEITGAATSPSTLRAEILPPGDDPHVRKLRLTMLAADVRPLNGTVTVTTNSKELPQIPLAVKAFGQGSVDVLPPQLYFTVYESQDRAEPRSIMLIRPDRPFRVVAAKSDNPALEAEIMNLNETISAIVQVTYRGGLKPGKIEGKITLTLADTDWPAAEVPYSGVVLPGKDPSRPPTAAGGAQPSLSADPASR